MSAPRKKRWIRGLIAAGLVLAAVEGVLRAGWPELRELSQNSYLVEGLKIVRPADERIWTDPDTGRAHTVVWDDNGLRVDGRRAIDPDPRRKTIMLVGDSYVEGLQAPGGGTIDAIMERLLRLAEPDAGWQVVNAGLNGSTIDDQFLFIKQVLPAVNAQSVVQFISPNDLDGLNNSKTSRLVDERLEMTPQGHSTMRALGGLYVVQGLCKMLAGRRTEQLRRGLVDGTSLEIQAHADALAPGADRALAHWGAVLHTERKWLLEQGVQDLVLVEVPVPDDWIVPERRLGRQMARHGEIADALGVPFKPLKPVFDASLGFPADAAAFGLNRDKMFFLTDPHWNTWGNLVVAMELASTLLGRDIREYPAVRESLARSIRN